MKKVLFILACILLGVAVGNFVVSLLSLLNRDE